jgi:phospho-N-acetylmuramoyl-pentapeptide-transferase
MIYHLFQWLQSQGFDFPGVNLVRFISFRALVATMTSLIVALWIGPAIIRRLQKKQIGETIRDLGLEGQLEKKGTPTMGGSIILLSILIRTLAVWRFEKRLCHSFNSHYSMAWTYWFPG